MLADGSFDGALEVVDDTGRAVLSAARMADLMRGAGLELDYAVLEHMAAAYGAKTPPFAIRVGDWQLDLPVAAARGIVNGVVLTSVLAAQDQASIPATVLSVVVPLLFNLERIRLDASERAVYAELLRDAPHRKAIEDWYASLPSHVRAEITLLEFRKLVEHLDHAGLADVDEFGVVTIDPPPARRLVRLRLPPEAR